MRKICVFIIVLVSLLGYNCTKDSATGLNENPTSSSGIVGRWQWAETSGGLAPIIIRPSSTELFISQFTSDSNYYYFSHDTLKRSTRYSVQWEQVSINDSATTIRWNDMPSSKKIVWRCTKDSLVLCDTGNDGYMSIYIRL